MSGVVDIIIIGGGHNGLVAACHLARAGLRALVLERREIMGGAAVTEQLHPGFRCPTLSHAAGPLLPAIVRDLDLEGHGLQRVNRPEVRVFAPAPDGRSLTLYQDPARTQADLEKLSPQDARAYGEFHRSLGRIGSVLSSLLRMTPPAIDHPSAADLWGMLKLGRGFRGLGRKDGYRLLRWAPMSVKDLMGEWFETELLRATLAARGIFGALAGPYSAGTSLPLLLQAALNGDGHVTAPPPDIKGGVGGLTRALAAAATAAGAQLRTGAEVERILMNDKDGSVAGVRLRGGEEVRARVVVSNADPKRTLLTLLDPGELDPGFAGKVQNYRCLGSAAKINLALSGLPKFPGPEGHAHLLGRIHIGPTVDYLEQAFDAAKYGDISPQPYLDITIPSLADPELAPRGGHVMSIYVQYAPYRLRRGDWPGRGDELYETVMRTLSEYAPDLQRLVVHRQVITPLDLEQTYGLTGGHVLHGEPSLDQFFTFRPILHWARYRTPVSGLYLCGAGAHPGGGVTGAPGLNASREIIRDLARGRA